MGGGRRRQITVDGGIQTTVDECNRGWMKVNERDEGK